MPSYTPTPFGQPQYDPRTGNLIVGGQQLPLSTKTPPKTQTSLKDKQLSASTPTSTKLAPAPTGMIISPSGKVTIQGGGTFANVPDVGQMLPSNLAGILPKYNYNALEADAKAKAAGSVDRQNALLEYAQASGGATNSEDLSGLKAAADAMLGTVPQPTPPVGSGGGGGGGGSAVDPLQSLLDQVTGQVASKYDPQQIAIQNALEQLQRDYARQQDATKTYGDVMSKRNQELYDLFGRQFSDITNQAVGQADAARGRIAQNTATSQQNVDTGVQALQQYLANQAQQVGGPQIAMAPMMRRDNGAEQSIIDALLTSRVTGLQNMQAALPREAQQMQGNLSETILSKLAGLDQSYNTNVATQQSNLQQLAAARAAEMQSLVAQAQQQAEAQKAAARRSGSGSGKAAPTIYGYANVAGMQIPITNFDDALAYQKSGELPAGVTSEMARNQSELENKALSDQMLGAWASQMAGGMDNVPQWIASNNSDPISNVKLTPQDQAALINQYNQYQQGRVQTAAKSGTATQKKILADLAKYGR